MASLPGTLPFKLGGGGPAGTIGASLRRPAAAASGREHPKGTISAIVKRSGDTATGTVTFTGQGLEFGVITTALKRAKTAVTGREHPKGTVSAALHRANAALAGRENPKGTVSAALKQAKYSGAGGISGPKGTVAANKAHPYVFFTGLTLAQQSNAIWNATRRNRRAEDLIRRQEPFVRVWDSEWVLQHLCSVEYKAQFSWISNDSGPGRIEIPADKPVAQWIQDQEGRIARGEGRNVHITVDYCGARWGGRLDKYSVEQREDGDQVLVCDFLHDYENL